MLEDPTRVVGFEEQYAAAAAVMAQVAGLPVRVVVGYELPADAWRNGRADVTANDISAWVELDAGELGWVPVDVTPDRSRVPDPETEGATTQEIAIPNPPPPPPPPPNVEPPRQARRGDRGRGDGADPVLDRATRTGLAPWAAVAVGVAGVPIALLAALRPRRRRRGSCVRRHRRRTPADADGAHRRRVGRGDRPLQRGGRTTSHATSRRTSASSVYVDDQHLDNVESDLRTLAGQVDRATFAAAPPADEHADAAWRASDEVSAELRRGRSLGQRVRMHLDPRPLRRDHARSGARPPEDDR